MMMPSNRSLVSLTYDWIAKMLYISRVITATGHLELVRVEIYNADIQEIVFPQLQLNVSLNAVVNSEINPAAG